MVFEPLGWPCNACPWSIRTDNQTSGRLLLGPSTGNHDFHSLE